MPEQAANQLCLLQPIEHLPSTPDAIETDYRRYLDYHLGRFLGCDPVYLYQALAGLSVPGAGRSICTRRWPMWCATA